MEQTSSASLSASGLYAILQGKNLPTQAHLTALGNVLQASSDEIVDLFSLAETAARVRKQWATDSGLDRRVSGLAATPDQTRLMYSLFDGRSGRHDQHVRWRYYVGPDSWLDRAVERHRIFVNGREPLEAVLIQPGMVDTLDVGIDDLQAMARVLAAPTGTPDVDVAIFPDVRGEYQISLLTVFSPPIVDRGWVQIEFRYCWPRLWDSLRDPADKVSGGRLGFRGDVASGGFELISRDRIDLDVADANAAVMSQRNGNLRSTRYVERDPTEFHYEVTR